jgi:tetratricopeptide (TPR) repeat protein
MLGRRYQILNQLGEGNMGALYRAFDRLRGRTVALKRVTTPTERLMFASRSESQDLRLSLAHEFETLATLRHPHIINVLDYGFDDQRQPYFTLELLENAETILEATQEQPLVAQVQLLVQLLQALAYLHRRGVLHRDLKPGNVLVVYSQVKLLDFGLATMHDAAADKSGTLAYMAPEILSGEQANEATDLYGVGMIAYELFAGRYPFDTQDLNKLSDDIMHTTPDLSSGAVDQKVKPILERLLAKSPGSRYARADEVIEALSEAIDQPIPAETVATRESYLQAAKFVGRDAELSQLADALEQAVNGRGGVWLVSGESGVGKSRLLEELRTRAMVQGVLVLRGQSVHQAGGLYQVWRDVLRRLSLESDLGDLEAGVLKMIVPDIAELLGREVPDVPELDPQATQTRLWSVVEELFRQHEEPILVILEDLQWGSSNSLALLNHLGQTLSGLPVLIVGSYRDEERPDLPQLVDNVQTVALSRFTDESIAELSEAMLGTFGREPIVVKFLKHETEGNAFFLVEVARSLADADLDAVQRGSTTLHQAALTGGVQRIIRHRIKLVPEDARPLLQVAAVAGRELDIQLLRALEPDVDIERWLTRCANAAVLDVQDGHWRFAHNRLRDGALLDLSENAKRSLHQKVAEGIEGVYSNDLDGYASALAHHWSMTGHLAKEEQYAALAGERALLGGAYQEAGDLLKRALDLSDRPGRAHGDESSTELKFRQASLNRNLGEAYFGLGQMTETRSAYRQALLLLGKPMPSGGVGLAAGLLVQVVRQALRRLGRVPRETSIPDTEVALLLEAVRNYQRLSVVYFFANQRLTTVYTTLAAVNLAERAGPSPELARALSNMTIASGIVGLHNVAERYSQLAQQTAGTVEDSPSFLWVARSVGTYNTGSGNWSRQALKEAADIAERLGDLRMLGDILAILAWQRYLLGEFELARRLYLRIEDTARRSSNIQQQGWAKRGKAQTELRLRQANQLDEVVALFDEALELFDRSTQSEHTLDLSAYGGWIVAHLRQGRHVIALEGVEKAIDIISALRPTTFFLFEGYVSPAEVSLALWEQAVRQSRPKVEQRRLEELAKKAITALLSFARTFPIGEARALLSQGIFEQLSGNVARANAAWDKSLTLAKQLSMPYEEGLVYYHAGRHLAMNDPVRQKHLAQAIDIFTGLGTDYELERAREALKGTHDDQRTPDEDVQIEVDGAQEGLRIEIDLSDLE